MGGVGPLCAALCGGWAAWLSVGRAGRKPAVGEGLFGSGRAGVGGGHGGPQVLPVGLGAVSLPQPGAEGASDSRI